MEITHALRELLFAYDRAAPLGATVARRASPGGLVEDQFAIAGARDARVPGALVYHAGTPPPRPALLIGHGLNSGKDDERLAALRRAWAEQGFACLTVDAPLHGERATGGPLDVAALFSLPYSGLRFIQQSVIDLRRAVDYLHERPDIDAGRLAYVGFSMSAFLGVQFVAVEPRVRAACFAMGGAGLFHFLVSRAPTETRPDHELVANLVDPLHYAPRIAPRPVLQVNGLNDAVVPAALAHLLHGALAEPKQIIWYPGGHDGIPRETVDAMYRFLTDALAVDVQAA